MHPCGEALCVLILPALLAGCIFSGNAPSAKGSYAERWDAVGASFSSPSPPGSTSAAPTPGSEEVAEVEVRAELADSKAVTADEWRIGTPHPTAPNIEAASNKDHWRPMPGYSFRDQQELTVRWVPGIRHREDSSLVAGEIEGTWVAATVVASRSAPANTESQPNAKPRDRNTEKLFFPFARGLTGPWFSGQRFYRPAPNPTESLDRILALSTGGVAELAKAQERYVSVAFDEKLAWDLQGGVGATPREIELLAESFIASIVNDRATMLDNVMEAIEDLPARRRRIERDMVDGHTAACRAARGLADLWRSHLVGFARQLAGSQSLRRGAQWMVVLSPDPRVGGLAVVNETGKQLRDVTLEVHSGLAGPNGGFSDYFVHLQEFGRGQRLVLPIDLALAVFEQQPTSRFRGTLTYSLWAREGRIENVTLSLPSKEYEGFRTNATRPRELVLRPAE